MVKREGITVTFEKGRFVCHCLYEDRLIPKAARFCFDPVDKVWFTTSEKCAERLKQYCDAEAKQWIKNKKDELKPTRSSSVMRQSYRYNM